MKKYVKYILSSLAVFLILGFVANAQGGKFFRFLGMPEVYKWITSPQEFIAEGGDWNNIETFGELKLGSVSATNEYIATTTIIGDTNVDSLIASGRGVFGSVIITTAGNTVFKLLNATTTDATKRIASQATSTILLADFPASATVGVYTFDVAFTNGLFFDVTSGTLGTTTITWKR